MIYFENDIFNGKQIYQQPNQKNYILFFVLSLLMKYTEFSWLNLLKFRKAIVCIVLIGIILGSKFTIIWKDISLKFRYYL